ncbi:3'-5' exonuclease family protein [Myroides odoratus]|uniref:3'-5' exoribonuclease n=1 Tax=Myroides odoratus TaxID=256 RepID=A0A9Q6Z931_MYROD|nr:3'-5' exoribonuclease [Myroides odoratus]EHQ41562.1 hypothetical protein Myrod_0726 [Myroides odoratus DSM 2801]EKB02741.1 hypothetical protein HMPREF9716_03674 [Myroides odoratus CIP 103059]QQT98979.1 3'-5' exoribonuclease [Myroides odoratus]WQD58831.1 3'-5' exoribonuclease [Myroides odoratus]STZ28825.1 Uncharacterised protein [Myroides odoratus]
MKYFYDTEFLEGPQTKRFLGFPIGKTKPTIDLISIGIVSEDNREYYAISKDFNLDEAWNRYDEKLVPTYGDMRNYFPEGIITKVYWIRENVLMPIFFELAMREFHDIHFKDEWLYKGKEVTLEVFKSHETWSKNKKWFRKLLDKYGKSNKQIAGEIIGFLGSITKPELYGYYSAYDHVVFCWLFGLMKDLPKGFPMYTIDVNQIKEEIQKMTPIDLKKYGGYPKEINCHNALSDAKWTKDLFYFLNVDTDTKHTKRRTGRTSRLVNHAVQTLFTRGFIRVVPKHRIEDVYYHKRGYTNVGLEYIIDEDFDKGYSQKYLFNRILKRLSIEYDIKANDSILEVDVNEMTIRLINIKK